MVEIPLTRITSIEFTPEAIATDPILLFFHYSHLPPSLQAASAPFCHLALHIVETLPRNAERTVALRKLLEAKDAAVRANVVHMKPAETFQTRLVKERDELADRLQKLWKFLDGEQAGVSPVHAGHLYDQTRAMQSYLDILNMRIGDLATED